MKGVVFLFTLLMAVVSAAPGLGLVSEGPAAPVPSDPGFGPGSKPRRHLPDNCPPGLGAGSIDGSNNCQPLGVVGKDVEPQPDCEGPCRQE